jgi:hypothetical protein
MCTRGYNVYTIVYNLYTFDTKPRRLHANAEILYQPVAKRLHLCISADILSHKEGRMPRRDGTGPSGKGPKTGRGMGPCKPQGKK